MLLLLLLSFLFSAFAIGNAAINSELLATYFQFRHVNYGSVYGCFEGKSDHVKLARELMQNMSLAVSVFNIREIDLNITDTNVFTQNNRRLGIVLDGDCPTADYFLQQSSASGVFTDVHYWLIFLGSYEAIQEQFEDLQLSISSDVKVAILNIDTNNFDIYDVYNPASDHGGELKVSFFNTFESNERAINLEEREDLYWRRRNMTGVLFNAMVVLPKGFEGNLLDYLESEDDREVNTFNRFHSVLIYHIRDYYNFTLNITWSKSWGVKILNNFDGLVRALQDKQVDFGMSPIFVAADKFPAVDYGRRTWSLRSAFLFRIPKPPPSFRVFLRPLNKHVWYVVIVSTLVIIVLIRLALMAEYGVLQWIKSNFEGSWSFVTLFTIGALCQQGADQTPKSFTSRILFIYTFLFTIMLYQFYAASIVSILLMTPARIIKTVEDLVNSQLKLGVEDVIYNRDYIMKLKDDPVIKRMKTKTFKKSNVSFYCDPEVGLPLVAKGGYGYHAEVATAYPFIERTFTEDQICNLDEIQLFQEQQLHQPLQKNSPIKDMIDFGLHRLDETGLMKRQMKFWNSRKPACIRSKPPLSTISMDEFYPALVILGLGIVGGLFFLLLEIAVHIKRKKDMRKRIAKLKNFVFRGGRRLGNFTLPRLKLNQWN